MSKYSPSFKPNIVAEVHGPKSGPNSDTAAMRQPRSFKVVGNASNPAPMAKGDDGKPRPANRPASEGN
jgi:hypothetical protein